ncbi:hypothetical protein ACHAXT_009371 [Thalassiosira profunda]
MSNAEGAQTGGSKEMKGLVAAAAAAMAEGGDGGVASARKKSNGKSKSKLRRNATDAPSSSTDVATTPSGKATKAKSPADLSAARARRLEQNRRAAVESRRRKKVMIAELQRSVAFYTKANESLRTDNLELEHRVALARQGVPVEGGLEMQTEVVGGELGELKSPPEEIAGLPRLAEKSEQLCQAKVEASQDDEAPQHAVLARIPFPLLHPSVSPTEQTDQAKAHATATQALYETLGYPAGAARAAANALSLVPALAGTVPGVEGVAAAAMGAAAVAVDGTGEASLDGKPSAEPVLAHVPQVRLPPLPEEVGSDKYIESLRKYAMEQTALANNAAAAANAAIQAMNWHKMMKANGTKPAPVPSASNVAAKTAEEEEPPSKKQRS